MKQRLDSEIRVREGRDARLILDTQELAASREKERTLRQDIVKLQTDLDKERLKNKTIKDKVDCRAHNNITFPCFFLYNGTMYSYIFLLLFFTVSKRQSTNNFTRAKGFYRKKSRIRARGKLKFFSREYQQGQETITNGPRKTNNYSERGTSCSL